ncbi:putative EGF-like domain, peptidase M8, leishmanolysin, EGF-like domain, extracellular [Helianthus debilis subsp. tardiflorus]
MLFIWKLQSIINQLKIFSKTFNTFPLLSRMYSLCSIGDSNAKSLHRSLNLNHHSCAFLNLSISERLREKAVEESHAPTTSFIIICVWCFPVSCNRQHLNGSSSSVCLRNQVYGLIISTKRLCSRFYDGCYQQKYVNNMLEVVVDGIWKVCSVACGPIQFPAFNGDLICTLYHELYSGVGHILTFEYCPNSCNSNGDCVGGSWPINCSGNGECLKNGICECANGYTGIYCLTYHLHPL